MIDKLKNQQEKLLFNERHEAWSTVARKLAHEIKNPLTPIQLTIDNLRSKYLHKIDTDKKEKFNSNLNIILNQINQIEKLVNEFSDFARMPKPLFKNNNIIEIIENNIKLISKLDENTSIIFRKNNLNNLVLSCDYEQINRVIFNLIKNSIESIKEKSEKNPNFKGIINIEIIKISDYIDINLIDNGVGFADKNFNNLIKPYYTTKKNGSGLGLSIVNKIIIDHNGFFKILEYKNGAKIKLSFPQ